MKIRASFRYQVPLISFPHTWSMKCLHLLALHQTPQDAPVDHLRVLKCVPHVTQYAVCQMSGLHAVFGCDGQTNNFVVSSSFLDIIIFNQPSWKNVTGSPGNLTLAVHTQQRNYWPCEQVSPHIVSNPKVCELLLFMLSDKATWQQLVKITLWHKHFSSFDTHTSHTHLHNSLVNDQNNGVLLRANLHFPH